MRGYRRGDIQGLRGVAVLLVLIYHADLPVHGGFIGVDIFFVISGFVITQLLRREFEETGSINLFEFYKRRYLRLAPNLAFMIASTLLAVAFLLPPFGWQQDAQKTAVSSVFSVSNFVLPNLSGGYFDLNAGKNPFLHTWSLSLEEQFYLIFPILILLFWRTKNTNIKEFKTFLVVLVLSFSLLLCIYLSTNISCGSCQNFNFYSLPTRAWEFGCGVMAARLRRIQIPAILAKNNFLPLFSFGVIILSAFLLNAQSNYPGLATLPPVLATSLILITGEKWEGINHNFLSRNAIAKIGDMSYSLYLWHWPFIVLAKAIWPSITNISLYATFASLFPAYLAYLILEKKIRSLTDLRNVKYLQYIMVFTFVPVIIATTTWITASKYWQPKFTNLLVNTQNFTTINKKCHYDDPNTQPQNCNFNLHLESPPIYLIGDSNAGHLAPGLEQASLVSGHPLIVSTAASCPFINTKLLDKTKNRNWECQKYYSYIMKYLKEARKGVVIISFSERYFTDANYILESDEGNYSKSVLEKYSLLNSYLTVAIKSIQSLGHEVIFIDPVPHFVKKYAWSPRECLLPSLLRGCEMSMPLEYSEAEQKVYKNEIEKVTNSLSVKNYDLSKIICPNTICSTKNQNGWIYSDGSHLTNDFSKQLVEEFTKLIGN